MAKEQREFHLIFKILKREKVHSGEVGALSVCTQIILSQTAHESNELVKYFGGKNT